MRITLGALLKNRIPFNDAFVSKHVCCLRNLIRAIFVGLQFRFNNVVIIIYKQLYNRCPANDFMFNITLFKLQITDT